VLTHFDVSPNKRGTQSPGEGLAGPEAPTPRPLRDAAINHCATEVVAIPQRGNL
jgi:hypothetical protein